MLDALQPEPLLQTIELPILPELMLRSDFSHSDVGSDSDSNIYTAVEFATGFPIIESFAMPLELFSSPSVRLSSGWSFTGLDSFLTESVAFSEPVKFLVTL